jgi:exonuclease VII small subunit
MSNPKPQSEQDLAKLEAKIKELEKRSVALEASADETHEAAQAAKSESQTRSKELGNIKQRRG